MAAKDGYDEEIWPLLEEELVRPHAQEKR